MLSITRTALLGPSRTLARTRMMSTATTSAGQIRSVRYSALAATAIAGAGALYYAQNPAVMHAKEQEKPKVDMNYKYVIVGAGVAAKSCLKTLNEMHPDPMGEDEKKAGSYDGK
ncbi:hypothetical protein SARC_05226, partial [Sphaeroforma arctica JP610]